MSTDDLHPQELPEIDRLIEACEEDRAGAFPDNAARRNRSPVTSQRRDGRGPNRRPGALTISQLHFICDSRPVQEVVSSMVEDVELMVVNGLSGRGLEPITFEPPPTCERSRPNAPRSARASRCGSNGSSGDDRKPEHITCHGARTTGSGPPGGV
ncbi:hypothetical protein EYF80_015392 [Liparis tanakae]|uniref:Uncharacterized protein n=1 Tax=Liparis tanakae TaxID=230148 RepID=A0A4Z2IBF4_9TELE|nr:hypothetical protein EYF80_015392 [Liparis tanakae]